MPDASDSERESPFRLSRPREVTEFEDHISFPASRETESPYKLSRLCELPESEPHSRLSTLHECAPDLAALDAVDAELISRLPVAIAEQYAARLCHVERLRRDAEQRAAELEASLPAVPRRDARRCCRSVGGAFLALALVSTIALHARGPPQCSADPGEDPPAPVSASAPLDCAWSGCLKELGLVELDLFTAVHRRDRDTKGYMQALSGVDSWVTGAWEEGLFRGKLPTGALARCVNGTQVAYRNLVADLNGTLMQRQNEEAELRTRLGPLRRSHLGLGARLSVENSRN